MTLHRYLIRFTTHKLIELMYESMTAFGLPDIERIAKEKKLNFEKEVKAFTAEDALVQLRAAEGGSLNQPPFVLSIEALPDAPEALTPSDVDVGDFRVARQAPYEREALCACGAVAVQWRKDKPVCALHRSRSPAEDDE